ncbi:MAG TPA: hypothetical protein VGF30_02170 [Bacteroidia bacterium]
MKIISKYPLLTDVKKIDEDTIVLEFRNNQGVKGDLFVLKIIGTGISKKIELIKEYHLNVETVIEDEDTELIFYVGNLNESPDWGDWGSFFSLPFDKYEGTFIDR